MRSQDIEAVGEVAGEALAAGGSLVRDMHAAIAERPFGTLGMAALPARKLHDGISRAVYGGIRGALRSASRAGASVLAAQSHPDAPALTAGVGGSLATAALNGFVGNHLAERDNELALDMAIRRRGREVAPTRADLADAFPAATDRVAIFIHGLCETDEAWRLLPLGGERPRPTYGRRLREELGYTPVYLRYNTGLRVSDNGRALARLLDAAFAAWPTEVEEIVLVGHSMGGLVARSACHYGEREDLRFTAALRHVFCLGSPHLGADLEKGANALGWALGRVPEMRAFANALNARSVGIKDLRFGSCVEEDWRGRDPDEFLRDRCREVPFLSTAHYYFVGAALRPGPVGTLLGDLLVRMPSASGRGSGRGRSIPFEIENGRELSGITHFDLLNHPAVYAQLRRWLTRKPRTRTSPRALPAPA